VYTQAITPAKHAAHARSVPKRSEWNVPIAVVCPTFRREKSAGRIIEAEKGHKKGHETVPFWVLDGFREIGLTLLERMAGTTRLELATSAVTGSVVM
jgi:hypothetical protein